MNARDLVALVHLVGFATGIALYGMLAVMIWRGAHRGSPVAPGGIPLLAAVLGLIWNAGALVVFGAHDFGLGELSPWYSALAYESARALLTAVTSSGDAKPESVRTQLATMKMESILPGGRLLFGPDQQAQAAPRRPRLARHRL